MDKGICKLCGHSGAVYLLPDFYKEDSVFVCEQCSKKIIRNNSLILRSLFLGYGIVSGIFIVFIILFII